MLADNDANEIIRQADRAMYIAKGKTGSKLAIFGEDEEHGKIRYRVPSERFEAGSCTQRI